MPKEYSNLYLEKLKQVVMAAPKLKNSYIYITPIKILNPENKKTSLLEKNLIKD